MRDQSFGIAALRAGFCARAFTPLEVATEALRRIASYDDLAVWISRVPAGDVMARAQMLTDDPDAAARLPLYGIPFAVKDNIDCAQLPTTAACPDFAHMARRDAFAVAKLIEAGAILLGKTNLDQFATGLVGTRSPYGAPHSVFDARYVSGGSSSGSAVAVSVGLVSFALGTDTAGSGRVPAAYNNIVGIKPTRGLVSTHGVIPACRSLDCVSVFAGSVGDADTALRLMQGFDAADAYARRGAARALPMEDFHFGVLGAAHREFHGDQEMAELYDAAIMRMVGIGGTPVEIDFTPFLEAGALLYEGPFLAERTAALRDFMEAHADAMDTTVRGIVARGLEYGAVDAWKGEYRRMALKREAERAWKMMDVFLLPTVPAHDTIADVKADPVALNAKLGRYTNFVNLLDCCAIAVPGFFRDNRLPFGLTLVAPAFSDADLAILADRFHRAGTAGQGLKMLPPDEGSRLVPVAEKTETVPIFVVGAHLSGMPLNHELTSVGGRLIRECRTAGDYRFYLLPNTTPPKPGLVRTPGHRGEGILGEVWELPPASFGAFVARIPAPLGIGRVMLEDGTQVSGFLCEAHAVGQAREISEFGGWRKFLASDPFRKVG